MTFSLSAEFGTDHRRGMMDNLSLPRLEGYLTRHPLYVFSIYYTILVLLTLSNNPNPPLTKL